MLALLADSTNAERPGFTATEQTVAEGVRSLFARAKNRRIIVATFASNIYRIQQIIDLAIEYGRKVAVNGRSFQIKRGETVQVPAYVAEVLEQSMAQDNATANLIERESSAYAAEAKARNI